MMAWFRGHAILVGARRGVVGPRRNERRHLTRGISGCGLDKGGTAASFGGGSAHGR